MENYTSFYGKGPKSFYNKGNSYGGLIETIQDVTIGPLSIASFNTNIKKPLKNLLAGIEPVQDLHGYNSPWPAGGGKNKLPNTYTTTTINGVTFTVYDDGSINVNGTATGRVDYYLSGSASGGSLSLPEGSYILTYGDATLSTAGLYLQYSKSGAATTVNNFASFEASELGWIRLIITTNGAVINNVKIYPMIRLASVTDATFAPYSNICPITGQTGAKVTRCGKNLLPNLKFQNSSTTVGIGQMEYVSSNQKIYLSAGTYTLSTVTTASGRCFYKKKGGANMAISSSPQFNPNGTFTITETGFYAFWIYSGNGFSADDLISFQLEKNATATDYEPYQGDTYDITFPSEAGTVYGGTLDVTSGVLTVDRAMVDMGTIAWVKSSVTSSVGGSAFTVRVSTIGMATRERYAPNTMLSSAFVTAPDGRWYISDMPDNEMFSNLTNLYISASQYDTVADFKAAMNGVQLCYELATPITYQLTSQQITTLLGENNVWADTGEIKELTYSIKK